MATEQNFLVSARKYRPDTFASVVGQSVVTSTLKRQLLQDRTAQAYLFCGPRGVGKTTCARIFAKALTCEHLSAEGDPCNECSSCRAFDKNNSFSVVEIDAASNSGTAEMRDLVSKIDRDPRYGRHNVYIIDEVHMLSTQAFNVFLKTLEEPPAHVVFILATTEKHKVLPTILSRCQIFDFNRIQVDDTINFLASIAGQENVEYEREALNLIALKADGAMRDALSIFDQVVSFSDRKVTREQVVLGLNLLDLNTYFDLSDSVFEHDYMRALRIVHEVVSRGFNLTHFMAGLTVHFRNLLLAASTNGLELLEVGRELSEKYATHAKQYTVQMLFSALQLSSDAEATMQGSANQRLHVELLFLTLCNKEAQKKT
ncbi:MAG: DNA polymerase III subunit gamma/tau [Bacteroides sp.]